MENFTVITPNMMRIEALNLEILNQISRIANSTLDLQERLDAVVEIVVRKVDKDACAIFLIEGHETFLQLKAASGFEIENLDKNEFNISSGLLGKVMRERVPLTYSDIKEDLHAKYLVESCFQRFNSILSVPILMGEKFIGIISLHTVDRWNYSNEEVTLLSTIANDIAGIIQNSLLFQSQQKRLEHFEAIQKIGRAINSTLNLNKLLQMIIESSVTIMNARGGVLKLCSKDNNEWITKSYCGHDSDFCNLIEDEQFDEKVTGLLAEKKDTILISKNSDVNSNSPKNLLSAPLISRNMLVGSITLHEKCDNQSFTEDDKRLISTLADQASTALENARLYSQMEKLANENKKRLLRITVIYKITTALKTTLDLDKLTDIALAGITMGGGLGFNRGMLFLKNKEGSALKGRAGVGPDSPEDALNIWSTLEEKGIERDDISRWISREEHITSKERSHFNKTVQQMVIPVSEENNVFMKAFREKKAFVVSDAYNDDSIISSEFWKYYRANEFALIPLTTETNTIGLLVVDNTFTNKKITTEDLEFTKMLANHTALALENGIIHTRLEEALIGLTQAQNKIIQSEKMVALGELSTNIAHEIRNPLLAINGFANRIRKLLPDNKELNQYGDIIIAESNKLEKVLEEVLVYSESLKKAKKRSEKIDLNTFLTEYLKENEEQFAVKNIDVVFHKKNNLPTVKLNSYQLKQVLTSIVSNAEQALEKFNGGTITVMTNASDREVSLSIANSGDPILPDVISNIFNPFFTTKKRGTGLGLAIVHRIINANDGTLSVENIHEGGVRFTVTLPVNGITQG